MTEIEIIANNGLIAEFMGNEKVLWNDKHICYKFPSGSHVFETLLMYNTDWSWLMPVVEKITSIDITPAPRWTGFDIEIKPRGYVSIKGFPFITIFRNVAIEGSLMNALYLAIIDFIKMYNNERTNTTGETGSN